MAANDDEEQQLHSVALQNAQTILLARTRAEEALRKQSEWLRVTLSSIGDAVISTDAESRVTFMNSVAAALTGWTPADAEGQPLSGVFNIVNESTREGVANPALRALAEGTVVGLANHTILIAKNGSEWPIDDSAAPIRDESGTIYGAVLVFREITERKQREAAEVERNRLVALRADISTSLASTKPVVRVLQDCCEALVEHLDVAFGRIWTIEEGCSALELRASAGLYTHLDGAHRRVPIGQFKIGRIASTRQPHVTNNVVEDPNVSDPEWAKREGMIAFAGYPLMVEDRVVGVVAMFARKPFSENVLSDLAPLAHGIAQYLERKRIENDLHQSEAKSRNIVDSIGDGLMTIDRDWRISYMNPSGEKILGVLQKTHDNLFGKVFWDEFPDTVGTEFETNYRRAMHEKVMVAFEAYFAPLERWFDVRTYPTSTGLSLYFLDITKRKRIEEELRLSEARKKAILETALDCVITMDHEGKVVEFNAAAERTFGLKMEQVFGQELCELIIPPSLRARHRAGLARYLATGEGSVLGKRLELPAMHSDGTEFSVELAITRIASDGPPLFSAYLRDITERKRQEAALKESEEKLRLLADTIPQLAWMARPDGSIFWYNRRWYEYTGTTQEQMEGWGWQSVHDPDVLPEVLERWKGCIASGEPFDMVFPLKGADQQFRPFLTRINPLREEQGRILYWFGTNTDISDMKRMEEALRNADRRKDEFLATLAHELRNPLAPIRNSLQILKMPRVDASTVQETRDIMERQLHQLVRLVDDLLDVSRVMGGKVELRKETVELATVVARAVETAKPLIEVQGHRLDLSLTPESLLLYADPVRLVQVVGNLLTNAAKYTEANGHIWVTAERENRQAVLKVRDNGIGIAPDVLPHVFELFMQVDHAASRSQGGLGIGLTLVKNLVEMHSGKVKATSAGLGKGCEFEVRLPLKAPEQPVPIEKANEERQLEISSSGYRLLVVDDNKDAAVSLAMLLRLQGHEVRVAHDGSAALAVATTYLPNMVFLDIGMPGMDGCEVARRMRQQCNLETVVLVALTGWGQREDRLRTAEAGFNHHLVKPADPRDIEVLLASLNSDAADG